MEASMEFSSTEASTEVTSTESSTEAFVEVNLPSRKLSWK